MGEKKAAELISAGTEPEGSCGPRDVSGPWKEGPEGAGEGGLWGVGEEAGKAALSRDLVVGLDREHRGDVEAKHCRQKAGGTEGREGEGWKLSSACVIIGDS